MNAEQLTRVVDDLQWRLQQAEERIARLEKGLPAPEAPKYVPVLPDAPAFVPVTPKIAPQPNAPETLPELNLMAGILCGERK